MGDLSTEEKLARLSGYERRAFQADGIAWAAPELVRSLVLLRTGKRASMTARQRKKRRSCGGWCHLLLRYQVPLGRNGVGMRACERGECLSVPVVLNCWL